MPMEKMPKKKMAMMVPAYSPASYDAGWMQLLWEYRKRGERGSRLAGWDETHTQLTLTHTHT
jgi:hypothetical protein